MKGKEVFASLTLFLIVPGVLGVLLPTSGIKNKIHHHSLHQNADMFSFLALGDWGGLPIIPYHTAIESTVANQMGSTSDAVRSRFTIGLGDNFYFDGVKDVNDKRFEETYETVFQATSLDTPWYFIAGNHDHNGNVSAQIHYTDVKKRWNFPDYYYNLKFDAGEGASLEIVLIDTVLLCGNSDSDFLHKQPEMQMNPKARKIADDQWAWIEETLAKSTANYLIVGGHFPVYSVAEHGSTKCLVDKLYPLLHKYRVQAYICGHDHNLQHIEVNAKNWTTEYFVIGAANFIEDSHQHESTIPEGSLKYYWADLLKLGGFGVFQLNSDAMTFRFIDAQNGQTLHGTTMYPVKNRGTL
ncbi:tartrate-resistant acid phosphatase type 5-like [Paramacrobiotus metropolitanus]|uniref:tartrate-resistant acid phosphatase type 5-like n=1 Tax=Paramacrobiotus metropolitanus TaxID=2943436 RepID=UPI0024460603|nr:tartrate-resistant acid phosphatase type 5-like [Paramacrobiotus metropolitanus]